MKKIVLAEDHVVVRDGLKMLLGTRPQWRVVAETGDGAAVEDCVTRSQADLLLLDLDLPGSHGMTIMQRLKQRQPNLKILVLTGNANLGAIHAAFAAGADGYMIKHQDATELLHAVALVLAHVRYVSQGLIPQWESGDAAAASVLSPREMEILAGIACGFSSAQIAQELAVTESTVHKHQQSLTSKLSLHDVAALTARAIRERVDPQ